MKRILTLLLLTVSMMTVFPIDLSAKKEKKTAPERHMMTSEGETAITGQHRFVIDGQVAIDIPDSCYNIYISDIDKDITESDLVACVPVKNKRFRFETDLSTMKTGRIRAIMPGDKLSSAWIQIYFIPGFTVDMTVHNGYYNMHNEQQYTFMSNAWLNKEALADLFESMGAPQQQTSGSKVSMEELHNVLQPYRNLISQLKTQFDELCRFAGRYDEEKKELLKRINDINMKMEAIIDKYANSVN